MNDTVIVQESQNKRAFEIKQQIENLQDQTENCVFDTCDLLLEARENSYHTAFGYARFADWVENTPSLGVSFRQAVYYTNIAEKALRLEVDRATMKKVKISKLKEIFSLNPDTHRKEMLELLEVAPAMTFNEIRSKVAFLKSDGTSEEMVFMTIAFPASAKATFDLAFENMTKLVGSNQDKYGEVVDPPKGKLLEFICADFNSGIYITEPNPEFEEAMLLMDPDTDLSEPLGFNELESSASL